MNSARPRTVLAAVVAAAAMTTGGTPATPSSIAVAAEGFACSDAGLALALDPRGRSIVGGSAFDNRVLEWPTGHAHYGDHAIVRLGADGSRDGSFGDGGAVILDVDDFDQVGALAVDRPGRIVGAGTSAATQGSAAGPRDVVVVRLTKSGELDRGFARRGWTRLDLGGSESVTGTAADRAGRVLVSGSTTDATGQDAFVIRLRPDGRLDKHFGTDGIVRIRPGADAELLGVAVDGARIVAGGRATIDGTAATFVAAFDRKGNLDHTFGTGGLTLTTLAASPGSDGTFAVAADGSMAVTMAVTAPTGSVEVVTVRYTSAGELDQEYGADGIAAVAIPGDVDSASASAFTPAGALVVSGATYPGHFATGDGWVARLDAQGAQDGGFGGGAITVRYELEYTAFNGVALDTAGRTVVAGWDFSESPDDLPASDFVVARYDVHGTPDEAFGVDGVAHVDVRGGAAACGPTEHIE